MIKLFHAPRSRSSRIIWLLEELGADYTIQPVDIARLMENAGGPDPRNPHPDKQVPAIEHDGVLITESIAITAYLSDLVPAAGLAPSLGDAQRGPYLTWLAWYAAALEPAVMDTLSGDVEHSPMRRRNYDAVVGRLQTTLSRGPYLLGERFSAADLIVSSAVNWARQAFPDSAAIDAYAERCRERPAARRAVMLDDASGLQRAA